MLTTGEIKRFMDDDACSDRKRFAKVGLRYYESDHDIKQYRVFFFNADGVLVEDKSRKNFKLSHPFFTELVDQEVQYMLSGKEGFVRSDDPDLQEQLDTYFNDNEDFTSELYEAITGCVSKGFEYMYAYVGDDGMTHFACADSIGVVEVRAKDTDDGCEYVIRWYVDRVEKNAKLIRRIEVWDDKQVAYYVQSGDGEIQPDDSKAINPRPHTLLGRSGDSKTYYDGFGFIPFFRLDNCRKQFSGLKPIKDLIDDYDLMNSDLTNNIQGTNESLYVVKGYPGDNLDELAQNLRTKKMVGVEEGGDVEIRTVDIPVEARKAKMEMDEKNIYRFGMGFNSAQLGDGNITNIVIKSRYALLDLKCNKLEIRLKQFMRKIIKVVLQEVNDQQGTDYQMKDVYFDFEREVMTNAADNAQIELVDAQKQQTQINTLLALAERLDNETLMENICDVLDIEYNDIKDKLPDPEADTSMYNAQTALDGVQPEEEPPAFGGEDA